MVTKHLKTLYFGIMMLFILVLISGQGHKLERDGSLSEKGRAENPHVSNLSLQFFKNYSYKNDLKIRFIAYGPYGLEAGDKRSNTPVHLIDLMSS